jgi:topoisomerase-4 subunit B
MGKNTPDRQQHIIKNLRIEKDEVDAEEKEIEDLEVV